ncbi:MAG: ATP-binding protein [Actinobacteria bacterium]|nr:ATP-binding protein [Actinomycetota bacterium]
MFRSVKNWLTILILALVALAMIVAWAYVVPPLANRLDQQKLTDQRLSARLISETLIPFLNDGTSLNYWSGVFGRRLNARVVVLTKNLGRLADTLGPDPADIGDFPMVSEALTSGNVTQGVVTTSVGRYAATAVPLLMPNVDQGTVIGLVLVIAPLKDVDAAVAAVQRQLFFATVLVMGISLLLGYMASYFIARRLKRIERSAEAIAGGDLTATVAVTVEDEIGQLAATFNIMAVRLRGAFAQVEYERDRVEVLLNDLSEGVIGLSEEGTVTIANPASAELLDEPVRVGAELDETFPPDVAEAWHESRREDETQAVVFVHGVRTLEATTYPVAGAADFTSIVVLRDVTSQARLERARRDLIANASHEFKTPLFSLAGFLELIDEGNVNADEQREFLQLMRQQVDRLRNLAVSMLDLSRVEAGSIEMQPEDVDLEAVARSVLDEFQVQAQTKDLTLVVDDGEPLTAWCDEQRLAQVLRALVDNAVKFSPQGSNVRVATREEASWAAIVVSDDGPGIPAAELPHIFERFHRGSEERATTSGAGLGLSIARELTEKMGGSISAESHGSGASFSVRLPRAPRRRAQNADS